MLTLAQLGHAYWFFGNLYEAIVRMPDRLADEHDSGSTQRRGGPLARGSPGRYHIPAAPLIVGSTLTAVADGWKSDDRDRTALVVAAASSLAGVALTGYLVQTVNLRLLDNGPLIDAEERRQLVSRWHRVNRARLVLLAVASVALERAAHPVGS